MTWQDVNRNPSQSELRIFGSLLPAFGALLAASLWWRTDSWLVAVTVATLSALLAVLFLLVTPWRKPIYGGWMLLVYPIGWGVSHLVMAVIYFIVITPIGVAVRLLRGDPLARRFEPTASSYWHRRSAHRECDTYFREF